MYSKINIVVSLSILMVAIPILVYLYNSHVTQWVNSTELTSAKYHGHKIFWMCVSPPKLQQNMYTFAEIPDSDMKTSQQSESNSDLSKRSESKASINLAKEMIKQGRYGTTLKIYLHALALDPHNSDLLNAYGEFLETYKKDIVTADYFYWKVLSSNPFHTKALKNHRRTLPLVENIDRVRFERIENKLGRLIQVPDNHPGLRRQAYEQYIKHIYHTTAIEGNTFTLSQTRSFVENRIVITGKSIIEHNEILGMEAAMHFLNSSILRRVGSFKVQDISEIHRRVLGYVDPIGAGAFRTTQVFVGNHVPPKPDQISYLMGEFIDWLNSEDLMDTLHPVEVAALAHYKLVYIHPFYDGNGRTSRLLMNVILMLAGYPPIIIPVEQKQNYYKHLESANQGDVRPFIRFIASCTERTLDEYLVASLTNYNWTLPELGENHYEGLTAIT